MPGTVSPYLKFFILFLSFGALFLSGFLISNYSFSSKTSSYNPVPAHKDPAVKSSQNKPTRERVRVIRVVDGDTIEIEDKRKIRYIGVDTPETVKPNSPVQCFGKNASDKNKELVADKIIEIEKDISDTDQYGRLLRYVYVDGNFVNRLMVAEGFAYASTFPPDVKYAEEFRTAQHDAEISRRGLWGSCTIDPKKNRN